MDKPSINLWQANSPPNFWLPLTNLPEEVWREAYRAASPLPGITQASTDIEALLWLTLGEGRFGPKHWTLSLPKRVYYLVKPAIPRAATRLLRRLTKPSETSLADIRWPIERRYVDFIWDVITQILNRLPDQQLTIQSIWPDGFRYAFVLTHDVENGSGQEFVRQVADLEENLGFRSSFNFVPERYHIDRSLVRELRQRGFEVGIHGLKHDGKLFSSHAEFSRRAAKINRYMGEFGAAGFRSPLTHRNPEWMQALNIEYDLSFFDSDPFEPMPGGSMSIWPFHIGHFVELPYTLTQDYTLTAILGENSPRIWLEKVDFIEKFHGLALVNTHPDYLRGKVDWDVYHSFLSQMKERRSYWHALPWEAAAWWRSRSLASQADRQAEGFRSIIRLREGNVQITPIKQEIITI